MNGYFRLVNREGSSSLKLFPPTGEGKPVDVTDVLEYLTMKDYACDLPTLKRAVENVVKEEQEKWECMSIEEHMAYYESQGIPYKEAMRMVGGDRGISKRDVYQYLVKNKGKEK